MVDHENQERSNNRSKGIKNNNGKATIKYEALGTLDELQASLGVAANYISDLIEKNLLRIQKTLFQIGSIIANSQESLSKDHSNLISTELKHNKQWILEYQAQLPPLTDFVIPSGTKGASFLHVARTICRRAERVLYTLHQTQPVPKKVLAYMNQLSKVLFVFARYENVIHGSGDILRE